MSGPELRPNYKLLEVAASGSDRMVDARLATMLLALVPSAIERLAALAEPPAVEVARVRRGLHEALDWSARGALASDFLMQVLNIEWERLGGKRDDPAPWREEPPFVD